MSKFTPLRTSTRTGRSLVGDQLVERPPHVGFVDLGHVAAVVAEENEPELTLLVAQERVPGSVAVDPHRLGCEHVLDNVRRPTRKPHRREQSKRDRVPMPKLVPRSGLERVSEG